MSHDNSLIEKAGENAYLKLLHRFSPYVISALLGVIIYLLQDKTEDIIERLDQTEIRNLKQDSEIQDHESRMVFGKSARESFQADALKQFEKVNDRLDAVGARLTDINGSIIELQTTIKERVPARAALRDTP